MADPIDLGDSASHDRATRLMSVPVALRNLQPTLVAEVDRQMRVQFANDSFANFFSCSQSDLVGTPFGEVIGEQQFSRVESRLRDALNGQGSRFAEEFVSQDRRLNADVSFLPHPNPLGEIETVCVICVDMAEWREAETLLRDQAAALDQFLESLSDSLVWADLDRRIIRVNATFEKRFEYRRDEVIGRSTKILYADQRDFDDQGAVRFRTEAPTSLIPYEVIYRTKSGQTFPSETIGCSITDAAGAPIGFIGLVRDVSEKKEAEKILDERARALAVRNEELEDLAFALAHDLRGPARSIQLLADVAMEGQCEAGGPDSEVARDTFQLIHDQAVRMQKLTKDLLDYFHSSDETETTVTVGLRSLIDDTIALVNANPRFTITAEGEFPTVQVEATSLQRVLLNLISNAVHHHDKECGQIGIFVRQDSSTLVFEVVDDGPGIDARHQESIFKVFQRHSDCTDGTGIGLAVVRKLVHAAGGTVSVESSPGCGAKFRFSWPIS